MIGKTLSHYKVIEKIGQGGMGEVYRAEDTNLSREVAIKVLPEQFTKDPQRLARFEREAKLLASLNHPNIAAIYGLEEADGVRFLALELVPGENLQERVAKGPLPVEEALEVCRQIAEGVEAAHEKGVIHRDLKPANVKVTPEGKVKILDFGLAKAFEDETPVTDISQSPTLTEEMTRAGVILGTAAYMSPEQAKGKTVDKRADIFAFGSVLYELLTGKRAFEGETITETIAKVLESEPKWELLPENTPWTIRSLLRRCLTKNPHDRLDGIANVRVEVKLALDEPTTESPIGVPSVAQPPLWRRAIPWSIALVAVVVALSIAFWPSPPPESRLSTQFVITPPSTAPLLSGGGRNVVISPDGRRIAYAAVIRGNSTQLYVRSLDGLEATPITGTEGTGSTAFFSPNGESIAFLVGTQLKKVSLSAGPAMTLAEVSLSPSPPMRGGSWGPDDTIVFAGPFVAGTTGSREGLFRVSAAGGELETLAQVDREKGERQYRQPEVLPGGQELFYLEGNKMMAVTVAPEPGLTSEPPQMLFEGNYLQTNRPSYDVGSDGRFLMIKAADEEEGQPGQIIVVLNWSEELKRLVPTHDRPNHLPLQDHREARWRWDGCGLQGRGHPPSPGTYLNLQRDILAAIKTGASDVLTHIVKRIGRYGNRSAWFFRTAQLKLDLSGLLAHHIRWICNSQIGIVHLPAFRCINPQYQVIDLVIPMSFDL